MSDLILIKVLEQKSSYERFSPFIQDHTLSKEARTILKDMKDWFESNPTKDKVDWKIFSTWFRVVKHSVFPIDKLEMYSKLFEKLEELEEENDEATKNLVEHFVAKDYATKMSEIVLRVAEGSEEHCLDDVEPILDGFKKEVDRIGKLDKFVVSEDITEITSTVLSGGLKWRLKELNRSMGPLRKGDFIVVSARPDVGKTTFLASESTFMAPQLEEAQCVVWFNNEEDGKKVKFRVVQSTLARPNHEIHADPIKALHDYVSLVGHKDKIVIVDKKDLSTSDVEEFLRKHNAGLVIFDQLWKVNGFKGAFNDTDKQTKMFAWAREIAQNVAPVITVHQADATAEGVAYIEMNQLYASKTGIQGEADAIVTIGRVHEPGYENTRFLYIPKNKLAGDDDTDPLERNGKYELVIHPAIARFEGEGGL